MYVTAIRIEGLRNAPDYAAADLERVVELPAGPVGVAVADALTLFAASLDHTLTTAAVIGLGLAGGADELETIEELGLPVTIHLKNADGVAPLVDLEAGRRITVEVELHPDPPFFGRMRELAVSDPRLVTALGQHPVIAFKVGWLLSTDLRAISVALLDARVGDFAFPMSGSERPAWLPRLLCDVAGRFYRVDPDEDIDGVAERLLAASLSADAGERRRYERAAGALAGTPFKFGRLQLVRSEGRIHLCFGDELLRARQFGPTAEAAVRMVEAVHLRAPDVLVVEAPGSAHHRSPAAVKRWLAGGTQGEGATLEQVFVVPGGAG